MACRVRFVEYEAENRFKIPREIEGHKTEQEKGVFLEDPEHSRRVLMHICPCWGYLCCQKTRVRVGIDSLVFIIFSARGEANGRQSPPQARRKRVAPPPLPSKLGRSIFSSTAFPTLSYPRPHWPGVSFFVDKFFLHCSGKSDTNCN